MQTRARLVSHWSCIVLALVLSLSVAFGPGSSPVFAQNDDSATPDVVVEPTVETVPEETEVPTEVIETVAPEPTVEVEITEPAETPTPVVEETVTEPSPTVEPTATPDLLSSLTSAVAAPLSCIPTSGIADEPIAAGATLDYDCSFAIDLHGQNISPDQIALAWQVSLATDSSWTGQLAFPDVNNGAWSEPGHVVQIGADHANLAGISQQPAPGEGQGTTLEGQVTIAFQLRLSRPQCTSDPVAFQLAAATTASAPSVPQATVTDGIQPDPLTITPSLVPLVATAPVVSIESVSIDPVAFSLEDRTTSGVLTIRVENSTVQCSASDVEIAIQAFVGTEITDATSIVSVGAPTGAPDEHYVAVAPGTGTSLTTNVVVSTIEVGATPGSYTQTISFEVAVPGLTSAGTFDVRASATVGERGP